MSDVFEALSPQQRRFVEVFDGNATAAALAAGYAPNSAASQGARLLKNAKVAAAVRERETKEIKPLIASRQARQEFWTKTMQNDSEDIRNRLKASELLGRSEGDFLERLAGADGGPLTIQVVRFSETEAGE